MNIINESNRLGNELGQYREKFMSLFEETKRKIDSGIPMQEKNGVLNASIMMNQMIAYMQPLANKEKNINIQLGYPPSYNETTQRMLNVMRQYSNNINNKYTSKKRTQPVQTPVQTPR
jgi:predicted ribonuclease YlaK